MSLEIIKTTRLVGNMKIGDYTAKQIIVDIDEKGVSNVTEYVNDPKLYASNRREIRKQEAQFNEKRYEIEDEIVASASTDEDEEESEGRVIGTSN